MTELILIFIGISVTASIIALGTSYLAITKRWDISVQLDLACQKAENASTIATEALIELKALQKSTHKVQYVPLNPQGELVDQDGPNDDDLSEFTSGDPTLDTDKLLDTLMTGDAQVGDDFDYKD